MTGNTLWVINILKTNTIEWFHTKMHFNTKILNTKSLENRDFSAVAFRGSNSPTVFTQ